MKILGYIDDEITYFYNWQSNIGIWNVLLVPLEIFIVSWFIFRFREIIM